MTSNRRSEPDGFAVPPGERLQALPDGWTDFGPDSRRYAALGDAVTASVSEWIGVRLLSGEQS